MKLLIFSVLLLLQANLGESINDENIVGHPIEISSYDAAFDDCYANTEYLLYLLSERVKSFPNVTRDAGVHQQKYMTFYKTLQRSSNNFAKNKQARSINMLNNKRINLVERIRSKSAKFLSDLDKNYINTVMGNKNNISTVLINMLDIERSQAPSDDVFDRCINETFGVFKAMLASECVKFEGCSNKELNNLGNNSLAAKILFKAFSDYLNSSLDYMMECKTRHDYIGCFFSLVGSA
jgi:hypothetical protein